MTFGTAIAAALLALGPSSSPSPSGSCTTLEVSFTSDCFRAPGDAGCVFRAEKPDLGPQIAVWVEREDGTFVDTVMVTNATALFGIGNRPGAWNVRSGPLFPYGRRTPALPVWAHAHGITYPLVVMQDGQEDALSQHEDFSSPDPHFCRPMMLAEEVDAVTCATGVFRSDKGRLDASQVSFYPPRADIFDTGAMCPPIVNHRGGSCDYGDSAQYAFLDNVDVVAAATPAFGVAARARWTIPAALAPGAYAVLVEVGKEFDTNQAFTEANAPVVDVGEYGTEGNVGQPSVVFRVPFTLGAASAGLPAVATDMFGYGDPTGATGTVSPPDGTISADPGSGVGRLATTDGPGGPGRVHVAFASCEPFDCASHGAPPPVPIDDVPAEVTSSAGAVRVQQVGDGDLPVLSYETRMTSIEQHGYFDITPDEWARWTPLPGLDPAAPNTVSDLPISGLVPETEYVVGVIAHGRCGASPLSYARFRTAKASYVQLHGCFVATAAFGSPLAAEVSALRAVRDRAVSASAFAALGAELYYRAGPAAARVLADTDVGRAVARHPLRPLAAVARALAGR
jgi:hypothetical protein